MRMKWVDGMIFHWMLMLLLFAAPSMLAQDENKLVLSEIIQEALQRNPDLQAAEKRYQAALAKIPQAGALPDPMLSLNVLNLPVKTFVFDQEPMSGKQIAFTQKFPFPGKLGVKENIARENAAVLEAQVSELKNQLIRQVKIVFYELCLVDKSIETVDKNTRALEEFVRITETRYSVGKGLQQDVLRAQVELSKMLDQRIKLRQKRETLEARLNILLNREVGTPVPPSPKLSFIPFSTSLDSLQRLSEQHRPLLQAWQAVIRENEQKVRLARKGYLPDFSLTLGYTQRDVLQNGAGGADFFTGKVNIQLPLYFWRKQRKQVEETRYMLSSFQQKYQQVRNEVFGSLDKSLEDVHQYARLINLFQTGIIPQAMQSLQSAMAGYQTDKVDFLTLITNQINLFNFELDYYRVLSGYYKALADMEAATGVELVTVP
ncbi:MAG: TolC family protein [Calditrichaeota bacterium]|nr:MAG: TolC family protein [Calditrichota bacterium]